MRPTTLPPQPTAARLQSMARMMRCTGGKVAGSRDRIAFKILVSRYRRQVRVLAEGPLADVDHAESALRDTLISAFREIDAFGLRCTPGTWLYLHGLRAAFGRVNAAGRRYRRESDSADAALIGA